MATIKLYRDTNLHGQSQSFSADGPMQVPNLKDYGFNDCTSSLSVSGPGTWILYQNINCGRDGGLHWKVTSTGGADGQGIYNDPSMWNGKNDSISSLEYVPNAQ